MNDKAPPSDRATRASTEPASSLGHPAGIAGAVCANCMNWRRNVFREPPPEPDTHCRFLGIRFARDGFMVSIDQYLRDVAIQRNQSGRCYRNPKSVETHETHWCGEWQGKTKDANQ